MKDFFKDPILILIVLSILAVLTGFMSTAIAIIVFILTIFMIFFKDGVKSINRRSVLLFLLFYFMVVLYSSVGLGTLNSNTINYVLYTFVSYFSVLMISYHIKSISKKQISSLLVVFMVVLSFIIVGTTMVSFINPMAIRIYSFGENMPGSTYELEEMSMYRSMGMMNYSMAHAMSVVSMGFAVLICYSEKKWLKFVSGILLFLTVRLLFVMTITTAMLLSAIGVTLIFASYLSKGRTVLSVAFFLLIFVLFFFTGLVSSFLDYSQDTNTELYVKLFDLFSSAESGTGEGQAGFRQSLYFTSFRTFLHNPLFGGAVDDLSWRVVGRHSFFLDYLAFYGLFALLLFVSWWKENKTSSMLLSQKLRSCYYYSMIPFAGMAVLKAESVFVKMPFMTFVFLQLVFLFLNGQIRRNEEVK